MFHPHSDISVGNTLDALELPTLDKLIISINDGSLQKTADRTKSATACEDITSSQIPLTT